MNTKITDVCLEPVSALFRILSDRVQSDWLKGNNRRFTGKTHPTGNF